MGVVQSNEPKILQSDTWKSPVMAVPIQQAQRPFKGANQMQKNVPVAGSNRPRRNQRIVDFVDPHDSGLLSSGSNSQVSIGKQVLAPYFEMFTLCLVVERKERRLEPPSDCYEQSAANDRHAEDVLHVLQMQKED